VARKNFEEHDVQQRASGQTLEDDGNGPGSSRLVGTVLENQQADADAGGRDGSERGHGQEQQGPVRLGVNQLHSDAERDDQLVQGHGHYQGPDVHGIGLQADDDPFEHLVERQGEHGEQAAERRVARALVVLVPVFPVQVFPDGHRYLAGFARLGVRRTRNAPHGPASQAPGPVENRLGGSAAGLVRGLVRGGAPVHDRVRDLVEQEHRKKSAEKYQIAELLEAVTAGQPTGALQPDHGLAHLGQDVHRGGVQEHAAAEREQQGHASRFGRLVVAAPAAERRPQSARAPLAAVPVPQRVQRDGQHAQQKRAQAQRDHGRRFGHHRRVSDERRPHVRAAVQRLCPVFGHRFERTLARERR